MGYGSRALQLLTQYYKGEIVGLNEDVEVPKDIEPVDEEVRLMYLFIYLHFH